MVNKNAIIEVNDFSMEFGSFKAVKKLNFEVLRGETFGLLGSNGSGKTTTLRALLGVYLPTKGELLINGKAYLPEGEVRLGYLPEERGLYKNEPVIDAMIYFGRLKGMSKKAAREWSLEFLEQVDLADKAKVRLKKLSGGQQQKIQLGVTVMNNPELLILDEPTKGFDPVNRRLLMRIVEQQQKRGATVIYVSHDMSEVERLCDRILLLKDGQAVAYDSVKAVKKAHGGKSLDDIFVDIYGDSKEAD